MTTVQADGRREPKPTSGRVQQPAGAAAASLSCAGFVSTFNDPPLVPGR